MKRGDVWAVIGIVIGGIFAVILLAKVGVALWKASLPLATLGIVVSGFLVNCLAVVVLLAGFIAVLLAISALAEKLTEKAENTLNEIKHLRESHAQEIAAIFLGTATEVTVFTLSKDFDLSIKALIALYLLIVIAILHMMISANRQVKIVGRSIVGLISILTASVIVYRYKLYAAGERREVIGSVLQWAHDLKPRDLVSLLLVISLMCSIVIMTIVAARSESEHQH